MTKKVNQQENFADFSEWPIVVSHMPASYDGRSEDMLKTLDAALDREEPFVSVIDMEEYIRDPSETPEEKKVSALWLKQNRDRFFRYFRGTVYVLKEDSARETLLESGRKQAQATGFPVEAAAALAEAMILARDLLDRSLQN